MKPSKFIKEYPVVHGTDRDCEVPTLLEFIRAHTPVASLLDVGAHYTNVHYAKELRTMVKVYHGVDINDDPNTRLIVDQFFIGNACNIAFSMKYDMVTCVSTIEHAGISTYKADYRSERMRLFARLLELSNRWVWISFPVGTECFCPDQFANITESDLTEFETLCKTRGYGYRERFFYTEGAQMRHPWHEHANRKEAVSVPHVVSLGAQSICAMEIEKI